MRRLLLACSPAARVRPVSAQADGDPASDVLVFKSYFLPYAPQTPSDVGAELNVATTAAASAGDPIRVAVISGPGDLGRGAAVPRTSRRIRGVPRGRS